VPCAAGSFGAAAGATSCVSCPINTFSSAGAHACAACPPGQISPVVSNTRSRLAVTRLTTLDHQGFTKCSPKPNCVPGQYLVNNQCEPCAAGSFSSAAGATSCALCPADQYSAAGAKQCMACPSGGTSAPVRLLSYQYNPTLCLISSDFQSSAVCTPKCPAGKYLSNGQCKSCAAGTFSAAGATSCMICPRNTFSGPGATKCAPCPAGHGCNPVCH
jgi:hypothetical protein